MVKFKPTPGAGTGDLYPAPEIDLRGLRSFAAVASSLHFGKAADALNVSQSALSSQIRQLEERLGVSLFDRTTRWVELTPAGRSLLTHARELLSQTTSIVREVRAIHSGHSGRIRIGCTGTAAYGLLPTALRLYRCEYPDVEIRLRGGMLTAAQVEALQLGKIDFAVLRPPVTADDIHIEVIGGEPLVAAVPAAHPLASRSSLSPEDFLSEPFIAYRMGSSVRAITDTLFARLDLYPSVAYEVGETYTIACLVAGDHGLALVPASAMPLQLAGLTYVPLSDPNLKIEIAIAYRRDTRSPLVDGLKRAVKAAMQAAEHPRFAVAKILGAQPN